jgi:hypothetical protein
MVATFIVYWVLAVPFNASLACIVKVSLPDVVGVPVIVPVGALSERPPGRTPLMMLYVYGETPPDAVMVWEYATPTVAVGRGVAGENVIASGGLIVKMAEALVADWPSGFVTVIVRAPVVAFNAIVRLRVSVVGFV